MDFFTAQDSARSRSRTLVALFVAAVGAIVAAVYAIVHVSIGPGARGPIDPVLLIVVAIGIVTLVSIGSAVRTAQLRRGGAVVAEMLGGRRIAPNATDELERRLTNVVEEMAIASGTPVPAIFVLDHESGINAFAAGYTLDDAAVAVTRGALQTLNRDELQGVIAHEFSHILNGDMRLNIRLMGLLFGILLLAVVGRGLLRGGGVARGGRRGRGGGAQVAAVGLGLVAVGYIGVLFGRLIQAAVSRQREFLADAAAVQFTRDPNGIAGALKKIGGAARGSRIEDHHAAEASHFFFANGMSRPFAALLATHPPLPERIRRIERGRAAAAAGEQQTGHGDARVARPAAGAGSVPAAGFGSVPAATSAPGAGALAAAPLDGGGAAVSGASMIATVGAPRAEHVAYAHRLLGMLPNEVLAAAHDTEGAQALLFALLRGGGAEVEMLQDKEVRAFAGESIATRSAELARALEPLMPGVRLPLLDILLPALRMLPTERRPRLRRTAEQLVRADGHVDMFELALLHILGRQLAEGRNAAAAGAGGERSLADLRTETVLVLSAIAWSGSDDAAAAAAAFAEAVGGLAPGESRDLQLRPRGQIEIAAVDAALERLRGAMAGVRRRLLDACTLAVAHDGVVRPQEAELLRAIAEALDCPMPPALGPAAAVPTG